VRPNAVNDHWAPLEDGVLELRAWCLDNVERVTDEPVLINAAAVTLCGEKELDTLRALLGQLRAAETLDDVLGVFDATFAPGSAKPGGGAPGLASGVGGL